MNGSEFPAPPRPHVIWVPGADPDRDEIVARLRQQSDACIHADPRRRGLMTTWLEALACAVDDRPWAVILSDDADPLPGWQQHLERACMNSPAPLLGLTHFGQYGRQALDKGAPYGVGANLLWGGAIAYHGSVLPGLLDWATRQVAETGYKHDDALVAAYALHFRLDTAVAARAIFGQPIKASLLGHNTPIRVPSTTILDPGPPWSALPRSARVHRAVDADIKRMAARA